MNRKFLSMALALFLVLNLMPFSLGIASAEVPAGYTAITTAAQFQAIKDAPAGKYAVMNDIDLTTIAYEPIAEFSGELIGADETNLTEIKMNINDTASTEVGLFKKISGTVAIKNLRFTGSVSATTLAGPRHVGVLAGATTGTISGEISNCVNEANVTVTENSGWLTAVGGFIGNAFNGTNRTQMESLINKGNITAALANFAAGIVGLTGNNCTSLKIDSCENHGTITGDASGNKVAGIVGHLYAGHVTNCYNAGKVTSTGGAGIVGFADVFDKNGREVIGCVNIGAAAAQINSGNMVPSGCYYYAIYDQGIAGAEAKRKDELKTLLAGKASAEFLAMVDSISEPVILPDMIYDMQTPGFSTGVYMGNTEKPGYNLDEFRTTNVGGNDNWTGPYAAEDGMFPADDEKGILGSQLYSNRNNRKLGQTSDMFWESTLIRSNIEVSGAGNGIKDMPFIVGNYDGKGSNPYWLTFRITSGATVYIGDAICGGWPNNDGTWKNDTSDVYFNGLSGLNIYYKHFNAGELVQIPNYGKKTGWTDETVLWTPPVYTVVWDDRHDATLASASYNGVAVPGFDPNRMSYTIRIAKGTASVSMEVQAAGELAKGYTLSTDSLTSFPGKIIAEVTAYDGTKKQYEFTFTTEAPETINISNVKFKGQPVSYGENVGDGTAFMYGDMDNENMSFRHGSGFAAITKIPEALIDAKYFTAGPDFTDKNSTLESYISFDVDKPVIVVGMYQGYGSNFISESNNFYQEEWVTLDNNSYYAEAYQKYAWANNTGSPYMLMLYKEFPAGTVTIPVANIDQSNNYGGFAVIENKNYSPDVPAPIVKTASPVTPTIDDGGKTPTASGNAEIAMVKNNASGIVTLTADDGSVTINGWMDEMYRKYDLKGTIMMIGNNAKGNPKGFNDFVKDGYTDIASHSSTHDYLYVGRQYPAEMYQSEITDSKTTLEGLFPDNEIIGFASPGNTMTHEGKRYIKANFYAARYGTRIINSIDPSENMWYNLGCMGIRDVEEESKRAAWVDDVVNNHKWLIEMWHGIEEYTPGGYQAMTKANAEAHYSYLSERQARGEIWVASFNEAIKYIRERQISSAIYKTYDDCVKVAAAFDTNSIPSSIFNYPLSVKVPVPATWAKAKVAQNGAVSMKDVLSDANGSYIWADVVPNVEAAVVTAFDENASSDATLASLTYGDNITVEGFSSTDEGGKYTISLFAKDKTKITLKAVANDAKAKVVMTPENGIVKFNENGEVKATVVVTAENTVETATYEVIFKTGKLDLDVTCAGGAVTPDIIKRDGTTLAYSDRDNVKVTADTSEIFEGATMLQRAKGDASGAGSISRPYYGGAYDGKNGNPYWMTFRVKADCTVYMADGLGQWKNKPDDWTAGTGDEPALVSSTVTGKNNAIYSKHYNAGELVEIPNYGVADGWTADKVIWDPPIYAIVWDYMLLPNDPEPETVVTVADKNGAVIEGCTVVIADDGAVTVTLPSGAAFDSENSIKVTVTEDDAAQSGVSVTVKSADGAAQKSGTTGADGAVTLTIASAIDPEPETVVTVADKNGAVIEGCTVVIADDGAVTVTLPSGTAFDSENSIKVTVTKDDAAQSGVSVTVKSTDGAAQKSGTTGADGAVTLTIASAIEGNKIVTVTTTGSGSVTGNIGEQPIGSTIMLTAKPNSGYRISEWIINGATIGGANKTTYSFVLEDDVTVKVVFVKTSSSSSGGWAIVGTSVTAPTSSAANGATLYKSSVVKLASPTNGAKLYYTTDGSTPSETNGTLYTADGIRISGDVTVKVVAVKDGKSSAVSTFGYKMKTASASFKEDANSIHYMDSATEGAFEPDRAATRYEVLAALDEIMDIEDAKIENDFSDVTEAYKALVNKFAATSIIDGYPDKTFGGESGITRAEFVKMLAEALSLEMSDDAVQHSFADVTAEHWAEKYIASFSKLGYILGDPDGNFRPEDNVTRAEAVAVVNRIISLEAAEGAEQKYSDVTEEHWAYGIIMAAEKTRE